MFGAISKLFKKSERATPVSSSPFVQPATRGTAPPTVGAESPPPRNEAAVITPLPKPAAKRASGEALAIPYSSIIKLVPQELWGKLAPAGVAGYNLTVNRKTVLEQIPFGAVKVSFAELRRGAPSGVFIAGSAEDSRMIDLPLAEILAQLHPDAYARRPNQVRVQVSEELPDLFGAKGDRLANVRVLEKKAAKDSSHTTSMIRQKVPSAPLASAQPPVNAPSNITPLPIAPQLQPAPQPPPAQVPIPAPNLRMPVAPVANTPPGTAFIAVRKAPAPAGQQGARPLPKSPAAKVAPAPATATPAPTASGQNPSSVVATANALGFNSQLFLVPLDQIAAGWPAGVRQELAQLKMPDAKIAFPAIEICEGLKRGRVQYPWKTLRTWLQPAPFYATPSPHDEVVIELPLRTLTPLFLEFIRANASDRNVASAAGITDFFRRAEASTGTSAEPIRIVEEVAAVAPVAPPPQPVPMAPPVAAPAAQVDCSEAAPPGVAAIENGRLCLPVAQICQSWPEQILRDIQQFSLAGSRIEIPLEQVEAGLKAGRLEYLWKEICVWLRPASRPAQVSINGEVKLPLPLNVVAPMFLKQRDSAGARKRVSVAESIPDVFSAAGKPVVASSSAAIQGPQSEPEPEPIVETASAPARAPAPAPEPSARKMPATVAELFGELDKKSWTPNEIVQRTATLPNVAGSLIAMQDGLLVAHFMPPTMKTETIAAFVPQIFGRLNQYCKELQMGEARAVSFTVDCGTVHVFNAGIIYFAALSKPGALLPVPELQLIASELSRHTK